MVTRSDPPPPDTQSVRMVRTLTTCGSLMGDMKVGPDAASASEPTFSPFLAWNAPGEVGSAAAGWVARCARPGSIGTGLSGNPLVVRSLSPLDLWALVEVIQPVEGADRVGVFGCPSEVRGRICGAARRPGHLTRKRAGRYGARKCHRANDGHNCSPHALPFRFGVCRR
jgi:hypothetical protein